MDDSKANQDVFSGDKYAENYRKGRPLHPYSLGDAILKYLRIKVYFDYVVVKLVKEIAFLCSDMKNSSQVLLNSLLTSDVAQANL